MKRIPIFAKAFLWLFVSSGAAAFALYFGLRARFGLSPILFPFMRARPYYDEHPIPFLLSLAVIYAVAGSFWLVFIAPKVKSFRWAQIGIIPCLSVVLVGPLWGVIAIYYDMEAGFFPPFSAMIHYLAWGAQQGLIAGPISALLSFPINLVSYTIAYSLLFASIWSSIFQALDEAASTRQPGKL
jgi:hypothetical protein